LEVGNEKFPKFQAAEISVDLSHTSSGDCGDGYGYRTRVEFRQRRRSTE
jgi:hypothetical protein